MPDSFAPPASELGKIGVASFPTPGQGLALDQSGKIPQNVGVAVTKSRDFVNVNSSNTTSISLFSYTVVSGTLGTLGSLRVSLTGDYMRNNLTTDSFTLSIKFGGTTLWANSTTLQPAPVTSSVRHPWSLVLELTNQGQANSQFLSGRWVSELTNEVAPTTGQGNLFTISGPVTFCGTLAATGTLDTSQDQDFVVTGVWNVTSANVSFRKKYALVELF